MSTPITVLCEHIRSNGDGCQGIPLTGKRLCYYHQREFERRARMDRNLAHRTSMLAHDRPQMLFTQLPDGTQFDENSAVLFNELQLPNLEDGDAIQSTLSMLLRAIATGQVQSKSAGLMAYVLQIAAGNLHRTRTPGRDSGVYPGADPSPILSDHYDSSHHSGANESPSQEEQEENEEALVCVGSNAN
jgi:hypothetical protein